MCRLVAYVGEATSPAPLVFGGSHSLYRQSFLPRELLSGSVNADGYGICWYPAELPVRIVEARPIWYDPELETLLSTFTSPTIIALLRNATEGLAVERAGVPPLLYERWSFGLNGYIADFRRRAMRRMHAALPDELYGELRGVSDTEALFLNAVNRLRGGGSLLDALGEAVEVGLEAAGRAGVEAQLNMVLSDGTETVLSRAGSSRTSNSLYLKRGGALAPEGVLAVSEPLDEEPGWEDVPHDSLVRLVRGGTSEIVEL